MSMESDYVTVKKFNESIIGDSGFALCTEEILVFAILLRVG